MAKTIECRVLLILMVLSASAALATAQTVEGKFTAGEVDTIAPKHVVALEVRDQFNARDRQVLVMLTEKPVDINAALATLDPRTNIINQDIGNYISIWISPNGDTSMNANVGQGRQFLAATSGLALGLATELTVKGPDRVAGRIFTPKPIPTRNGPAYSADFHVDVSVTRPAKGTELKAGGGEPGVALNALYAAMEKKDFDAIKHYLSDENIEDFSEEYNTPEENLKDALDTLQDIWLPRAKMKITGGELRDNDAILEVEGENAQGTPVIYFVRMTKSKTGWVFSQGTLAGYFE